MAFDWSNYTVFVHGPGALAYQHMFLKQGLKGTSDIDKADIICFTGGEDVNPSLYGESVAEFQGQPISFFNSARDDKDAFVYGYTAGKVRVGICRGGQFLNVMNGGKMWQHVNGHAGRGQHNLVDKITGQVVKVTSTHHQMMRPHASGIVLATARESSYKVAANEEWHIEHAQGRDEYDDVEAIWYEDSKSLCFQPHPEHYGADECRNYFFSLLQDTLKDY